MASGPDGDVFCAHDARLKRRVALRVLASGLASDAAVVERFMDEARMVACLSHPNVLVVHDIGVDQERPYVVSELLEGSTLRTRLDRGALRIDLAIRYALGLTWGVAAAHRLGMVARGLDPESIFITRDDRVKILDFGCARNLWAAGSACYVSPEHASGLSRDARSDIFSIGVILYEMVTGQPPFRRGSPKETVDAVLKGEPAGLRRYDERIPEALAEMVRHCLEKNPDARFQSAADLAFTLNLLLWPAGPAGRTFRRLRPVVWAESTIGTAAAHLRRMTGGGAPGYASEHRVSA